MSSPRVLALWRRSLIGWSAHGSFAPGNGPQASAVLTRLRPQGRPRIALDHHRHQGSCYNGARWAQLAFSTPIPTPPTMLTTMSGR
jgi:hypothetical protein